MTSLRTRINQHCKSCIYDPKFHGTWRQQVTLCSITSCALHDVRPVTRSLIPGTVLEAHQMSKEGHAALPSPSVVAKCQK